MSGKYIEKIMTLIKWGVTLIEGNIMDIGLFIFSIKDACCKGVDNLVAHKHAFKFKFKLWKDWSVIFKREKLWSILERISIFQPQHLMIFIIKYDAAFVKEIGTKIDVVSKIYGINNKRRMFINNNLAVEFRETDFLQSHQCH